MDPPVHNLLGFLRDGRGASSADYALVLGGLCLALLAAGLFLDNDTQVRLQNQLMDLIAQS